MVNFDNLLKNESLVKDIRSKKMKTTEVKRKHGLGITRKEMIVLKRKVLGMPTGITDDTLDPSPISALASEQPADEWTVGNMLESSLKPPKPLPAPVCNFGIGGKWKRFVVGSDVHGDKQDEEACRVFFNFTEDVWKPQIRICPGDFFDFRAMRRGASAEEKSESMYLDYKKGKEWIERFYAPEGEKYALLGNHDYRLWEWAYSKNGIERDFAAGKAQHLEEEIGRLKASLLPYHKRDGLLQLGHLKLLHGFFCGKNAAKQHAEVYGSCLFGHTHVIDEHPAPGLERRVARGIGCLAQLDMEYNARQPNTLRQSHGFAYGVLDESTGYYHVWQGSGIDGTWILPSDIVEMS